MIAVSDWHDFRACVVVDRDNFTCDNARLTATKGSGSVVGMITLAGLLGFSLEVFGGCFPNRPAAGTLKGRRLRQQLGRAAGSDIPHDCPNPVQSYRDAQSNE